MGARLGIGLIAMSARRLRSRSGKEGSKPVPIGKTGGANREGCGKLQRIANSPRSNRRKRKGWKRLWWRSVAEISNVHAPPNKPQSLQWSAVSPNASRSMRTSHRCRLVHRSHPNWNGDFFGCVAIRSASMRATLHRWCLSRRRKGS